MNLLPHGSLSSPFFFPEFDTDVGQAKSQTPNNPWKTGPGESKGLGNVISLLNVEYKPEFVQLHPLEGGWVGKMLRTWQQMALFSGIKSQGY